MKFKIGDRVRWHVKDFPDAHGIVLSVEVTGIGILYSVGADPATDEMDESGEIVLEERELFQ